MWVCGQVEDCDGQESWLPPRLKRKAPESHQKAYALGPVGVSFLRAYRGVLDVE